MSDNVIRWLDENYHKGPVAFNNLWQKFYTLYMWGIFSKNIYGMW